MKHLFLIALLGFVISSCSKNKDSKPKNNAFAYAAPAKSLFVIASGKMLFTRSDGSHGEFVPK